MTGLGRLAGDRSACRHSFPCLPRYARERENWTGVYYSMRATIFPMRMNGLAMRTQASLLALLLVIFGGGVADGQVSEKQLGRLLERFPKADANRDGRLTANEAKAYREKMLQSADGSERRSGTPRTFNVDPGWQAERFPEHAVCYMSPNEIAALFAATPRGNLKSIISYPKPSDGSLRIVGTGHSFMGPGFMTFPRITEAAGLKQPPLVTHTGGGITGSARYKWEQENGIFEFDGKPTPKLLASIANAPWDAMIWGPYHQDHPDYYRCWIDFCLRYNPEMKFYLSDAWPQLEQLDAIPSSEEELTFEMIVQMGRERHAISVELIESLNKQYPDRVFVLPTSDAMVLAAEHYYRGELPGVQGIHKYIGNKDRSLWRDQLGHLGPGFDRLEGYVFYAAMYGRSPELIEGDIAFEGPRDYPSPELDRVFRKIAWRAALRNPLSGVSDRNENGVCDRRE
jgi:hypothetical protein